MQTAETQTEERLYTVPDCNLPRLREEVAKLNKRAKKLGVPEIVLETAPAYREHEYAVLQCDMSMAYRWVKEGHDGPVCGAGKTPATATGRVRDWLTVRVIGEAPKYAGWTFVATLEPLATDDGVVNLLQAVPGQHCPPAYRNYGGRCDHCKAQRRRNQTFVVRHENGEHKAVGRQCIKDFLGHTDPKTLAAWAELLCMLGGLCEGSEDEGWGGGSRGVDAFDLGWFLAATAACIRVDGWLSRTKAAATGSGAATVSSVLYMQRRPVSTNAADLQDWLAFVAAREATADDKADATAALEWARDLDEKVCEESNYLANINAVARAGAVTHKTAGLAASIIAAWQREQGKLREAARAAAASNEYVGEIGKRSDFEITVDAIRMTESYYGSTAIHKMHDAAGNALVWFSSSEAGDLAVGRTYRVKGTVKKHEEYKGRKQTVINRVVVYGEK